MAPPLVHKRALPPDPPDAGNRVSKPKATIGKTSRTSSARSILLPKISDVSQKDVVIEKVLSEVHGSSVISLGSDVSMEVTTTIGVEEDPNVDPFIETEDTLLHKSAPEVAHQPSSSTVSQSDIKHRNAASLMNAIKGLLDLTNEYLQNLETQHPGIGSDFLALLSDGASRAMRGQRVYVSAPDTPRTSPVSTKSSWANIAVSKDHQDVPLKKQRLRASPPQGQSKEDRRVMIRLAPDHEARKSGNFEIRQMIQSLVPDSSLVSDVWSVPSGVAILAPTPAKAASILQAKTAIEERLL